MSRPSDMPPAEHFAHGTRSRYVTGCRCDACRASNAAAYHARQAKAKEAALAIATPAVPIEKVWTARDGSKRIRTYRRACPGVDGEPCRLRAHLRKDSKGGVCRACRERLVWNGLVDAGAVRKHLRRLAAKGVGRRAVADAADVSPSTLSDLRGRKRNKLRRELERRILAVTAEAVADGALVSAAPTRELLDELVHRGFTKTALAHELGREGLAYYRQSKVTARTELAVRRLYRRLADQEPRRRGVCQCAHPLELERGDEILCGRCEKPVREVKAG
jgi:hypothetical protein